MARKYQVEVVYYSRYITEVLADDEGEALAKAKDEADDADPRQFARLGEHNSRILNVEE